MREQFQQYMQTQNYQEKTGKEYARFIEDLSEHCGRNIYEILSASELAPLVARYKPMVPITQWATNTTGDRAQPLSSI